MRTLLLFRGSAGCGKSTYIREHGLKQYTLSADDIRLLCQSPVLNNSNGYEISQANDNTVWKILFYILELRMQKGEFTVIDATNSKTKELKHYKDLAKLYRYRIYCIDMTDVPIDECKRRNRSRKLLKQVPDKVIDKFYSRFKTQTIPSGITVLKPDELDKIWYKPIDLSEYDCIHVIGDVHGCNTVLQKYLTENTDTNKKECYIYTGDYIDRGIENAEVMRFLMTEINKPNVICIEGNHEKWLWIWANERKVSSKMFNSSTKPQLIKANITQKEIRGFYRKLCQCCYFLYNGNEFVITHGGITKLPIYLTTISTSQLINGVGTYSDSDIIDKSFTQNEPNNVYQIHGHRNVTDSPIQSSERTYNLEGQVEFGGYLRSVQITKDGVTTYETKNTVFHNPDTPRKDVKIDTNIYDLVTKMRNNDNIIEKKFGRISSFNFSRKAFQKRIWDSMTSKARGLYIDTYDYTIAARAYDKFFNIDEREETKMINLKHTLQFPVKAYVKYNGFLGIVGYDKSTEELLITSKSSVVGEYVGYLKDLLYRCYGKDKMNKIKDFIKNHNVSFVFECCDKDNDSHIIEYENSQVFLLDIVYNTIEFNKLSYNDLCDVADNIGLKVKELAYTINSWSEFYSWHDTVISRSYKYNNKQIEGFVIEDSNGFMTKLKLFYYNFWKHMRTVANEVFKYGNYKYSGSLLNEMSNKFYGWCKDLYDNSTEEERMRLKNESYMNICNLRRMFFYDCRGDLDVSSVE